MTQLGQLNHPYIRLTFPSILDMKRWLPIAHLPLLDLLDLLDLQYLLDLFELVLPLFRSSLDVLNTDTQTHVSSSLISVQLSL
jgi:hypothetical protein